MNFKTRYKIFFAVYYQAFVSAPMGNAGGAIMNVPVLKFFGYPVLIVAIGSAAAVGFLIATISINRFFNNWKLS